MSEPLEESLSQFTPDTGRFDRDGLLFAAGRASARPNRKWIALVCGLAASQLVTLTLLWPRTDPANPSPETPTMTVSPPVPPRPLDKSELWVLSRQFQAGRDDLPPPTPSMDAVVVNPPLHAFGVASSLPN